MTVPQHPLGQILRDGEGLGLRFERDLAAPPERVWSALTERTNCATGCRATSSVPRGGR
jgi:hypothetical protein